MVNLEVRNASAARGRSVCRSPSCEAGRAGAWIAPDGGRTGLGAECSTDLHSYTGPAATARQAPARELASLGLPCEEFSGQAALARHEGTLGIAHRDQIQAFR